MGKILILSNMTIPCIVLGIVLIGVKKRVDVYDTFIRGAEKGFYTVIHIIPTMVALMCGVGVLRASGFLEWISKMIGEVSEYIGFPGALVPLTVVKLFSSSAATGLLLDLYKEYGTDSVIGKIASISMASTETIFYTMSVYFMTAKVNKSRYTFAGALIATAAGLVASVILGSCQI